MVDKIPICKVCSDPTLQDNQICVPCSRSFSANSSTGNPELSIA